MGWVVLFRPQMILMLIIIINDGDVMMMIANLEVFPYKVQKNEDKNRMGVENLAIVVSNIFYRTQVYLGSDLWVRVSETNSTFG